MPLPTKTRLTRPASALAALVLLLISFAEAQDRRQYKGRTIAQVMSYHGAPWLERSSREREENPSALIELLKLEPGATVADLGCGSGYHARRLSMAVGESGDVFCVDIQPQMLEIATQLAAEAGLSNIHNVLSQVDDPQLPEGELDLILMVDVYHELEEPEAMLQAIRRALKPNGIAALAEFRLEGDSAAHIKLDHRMSVEQVKKEWEPAGFELVELAESLPTQHLFLFKPKQVQSR